MFIKGIDDGEFYGFKDVFDKSLFFHQDSILRVGGWETPISIFYTDGEVIKVCFRKELLEYADSEEFPVQPTETLECALTKYKEAGYPFDIKSLFLYEVKEKLESGEYFAVEGADIFKDFFGNPYHYEDLWFPVDVDAIIINPSLPFATAKNQAKAEIVFTNPSRSLNGFVGFDGLFYRRIPHKKHQHYSFRAYNLSCGIKPCEAKLAEKCKNFSSAIFLKNYVIIDDGTCFNYDGNICEAETIYHKKANFINGILYNLTDISKEIGQPKDILEIVVPEGANTDDISFFDEIVIPSLESINVLNMKSFNGFCGMHDLIVYAGLSQNYKTAFLNIKTLNENIIFGGSSRGLASSKLLDNLNILKSNTTQEDFANLLNDEIELKKRVAAINGTEILEIPVSDKTFTLFSEEQRFSRETKTLLSQHNAQSQMLVIFSNNGNRFCAVTKKSNTGLFLCCV